MPVATDPKRITLHLDADPRFAAAVGGAVRCLAEASGMPEEVCREFQSASVTACLHAFENGATVTHVVEFLRSEDRIEVVVDSNSGSKAIHIARPVNAHT
jgi:hypothetical protein